jgi:hypothetical protein
VQAATSRESSNAVGGTSARVLVLEEEAEVVLGELGEGSCVAAHSAFEDEPLLVLQPGWGVHAHASK